MLRCEQLLRACSGKQVTGALGQSSHCSTMYGTPVAGRGPRIPVGRWSVTPQEANLQQKGPSGASWPGPHQLSVDTASRNVASFSADFLWLENFHSTVRWGIEGTSEELISHSPSTSTLNSLRRMSHLYWPRGDAYSIWQTVLDTLRRHEIDSCRMVFWIGLSSPTGGSPHDGVSLRETEVEAD
jgi:hypothetical protein